MHYTLRHLFWCVSKMNFDPAEFPVDLEYSPANARALRLGAGLTIPEAAAASNVKKVTWVAYEKGKIKMPAERWIAFKQCIKSGGYSVFMLATQRRGPFARSNFTPGEYTKDRETPVVNGAALLHEGRIALSLTARQLAPEIGLSQANAVFAREQGNASVLPDCLSRLLILLKERRKEISSGSVRISTKEDLSTTIDLLRISQGTLGEGAPSGIMDDRKKVFHLLSGRIRLTDEMAAHLTATAKRLQVEQIAALGAAIARIESALQAG